MAVERWSLTRGGCNQEFDCTYVDQCVILTMCQLLIYIKYMYSQKYFECMSIVQERVEALNEKLDLVLSGGEKLTDGELSAEGGPAKLGYGKKPCKLLIAS